MPTRTLRVLTCALMLTACAESSGAVKDKSDSGAPLVGDAGALIDADQGDADASAGDASEPLDASSDAGRELVRFQRAWDESLNSYLCKGCHPVVAPDRALDLSSIDAAYQSLVDPAPKCIGKPYVTPGNPDASLLLDVIARAVPGCTTVRMPQGVALPAAQVTVLRQWITDGALR